jgi:multiple sugar transport system ATP-binding protein
MAELVLDSVTKVYPRARRGGLSRRRDPRAGEAAAVRGLSLAISDGELVVLVGPSGCGKTTTLRMIAGLEEVTSGTVSIGGRVVNDVHPRHRDVAMVFQNYALYPHMTVRQNMSFALRMRRTPRAQVRERVEHAARVLGIADLMDRRPRELSGGQRQRVAVGRAIVREPKAFLFDEPLSNLDARLRVTTRGELKALHQRLRTTTVYVTHDQEEAMTLGDRIVVMDAGRVQQVGPPLEVYRRPANRFVAGFIGTPAMNFLTGVCSERVFVEAGRPGPGLPVPMGGAPAPGREVVMGVRPQALRLAGAGLPVEVRFVEPLGDVTDVTCVSGAGTRIVARVPAGMAASPGQRVFLSALGDEGGGPGGVHFFEAGEAGAALG